EDRSMSEVLGPTRGKGRAYPLPGGAPRPAAGAEEVLAEARAAGPEKVTAGDVFRFLVVSAYLSLVLLVLVVSRRVRLGLSLRACRRWLAGRLFHRVRRPVVMCDITAEQGHCYLVVVDPRIPSDYDSVSLLEVYEDDVPLPHGHCDHQTIRKRGG